MWHLTVLNWAPGKPYHCYKSTWANMGFLMGPPVVVRTKYVVDKRNNDWYCVIGLSARLFLLPRPFFCFVLLLVELAVNNYASSSYFFHPGVFSCHLSSFLTHPTSQISQLLLIETLTELVLVLFWHFHIPLIITYFPPVEASGYY